MCFTDVKHIFYILIKGNNSIRNTIMQAEAATAKRLAPFHASITAKMKATEPATGESVASIMAGNVMAAKVTYGT